MQNWNLKQLVILNKQSPRLKFLIIILMSYSQCHQEFHRLGMKMHLKLKNT
jgi:hypothetical protein